MSCSLHGTMAIGCAACDAAYRRADAETKGKLADNRALWEAIRELQRRVEQLEKPR